MALFVNGVEQSSITIDGTKLTSLYVDGVQVLDSTKFSMTVTSSTEPSWNGGTQELLEYEDNGDGTWHVYSYSVITHLQHVQFAGDDISNVTNIVINKADDLVNVIEAFFNGSNIEHIDFSAVDTSQWTQHRSMLAGCSSLICITNLDTTNSTTKASLFDGCTSLQYPDATDQADLVDADGANWVNPGACPIVIQMIETQNGYCEFDEGGTCTTPSLISSTINGEYTTVTYNWVVIGATIDGSNTVDYITVTTPAGNTDVPYTVQLTTTIDGVEYYIENDYTQVKILAPIRITGISQDISGSCDPT